MTATEKLKLLQTVKYKAWGFNMVGLFFSNNTGVPATSYKWNFYLRNCADAELNKVSDTYYDDVDECLDETIKALTELGHITLTETK